jgi:hypothetical protein
MLYSLDNGSYFNKVPHQKEYKLWMSRLSISDYQAITGELNSRIDGNDINTSSWMPGKDWTLSRYIMLVIKLNQQVRFSD